MQHEYMLVAMHSVSVFPATFDLSQRPLEAAVDPKEFEQQTGICWAERFKDVPDDGNCSMTAFWYWLRSLLW